jgi:phage/plasmid-associated DNA primase
LVFDKSFLGKEDPTLEARLANEIEAIVNWSVIGLKRLVANGKFTSTASSINEMESMKQQGSPINQFITDCLIVGETEKAFDKDIKASYRNWCAVNDEFQLKGADLFTALQDALRSQGATRKSSVRIDPYPSPLRGFTGISVKPIVHVHPVPFEKHYNQVKGGY